MLLNVVCLFSYKYSYLENIMWGVVFRNEIGNMFVDEENSFLVFGVVKYLILVDLG